MKSITIKHYGCKTAAILGIVEDIIGEQFIPQDYRSDDNFYKSENSNDWLLVITDNCVELGSKATISTKLMRSIWQVLTWRLMLPYHFNVKRST
jgi:hypothetical protein